MNRSSCSGVSAFWNVASGRQEGLRAAHLVDRPKQVDPLVVLLDLELADDLDHVQGDPVLERLVGGLDRVGGGQGRLGQRPGAAPGRLGPGPRAGRRSARRRTSWPWSGSARGSPPRTGRRGALTRAGRIELGHVSLPVAVRWADSVRADASRVSVADSAAEAGRSARGGGQPPNSVVCSPDWRSISGSSPRYGSRSLELRLVALGEGAQVVRLEDVPVAGLEGRPQERRALELVADQLGPLGRRRRGTGRDPDRAGSGRRGAAAARRASPSTRPRRASSSGPGSARSRRPGRSTSPRALPTWGGPDAELRIVEPGARLRRPSRWPCSRLEIQTRSPSRWPRFASEAISSLCSWVRRSRSSAVSRSDRACWPCSGSSRGRPRRAPRRAGRGR